MAAARFGRTFADSRGVRNKRFQVPWLLIVVVLAIGIFWKPLKALFDSVTSLFKGMISGVTSVTDFAKGFGNSVAHLVTGGDPRTKAVDAYKKAMNANPQELCLSPDYWIKYDPHMSGSVRVNLQNRFNQLDTLVRARDIDNAFRILYAIPSKVQVSYFSQLVQNKYHYTAFSMLRSFGNISDGFTDQVISDFLEHVEKLPVK